MIRKNLETGSFYGTNVNLNFEKCYFIISSPRRVAYIPKIMHSGYGSIFWIFWQLTSFYVKRLSRKNVRKLYTWGFPKRELRFFKDDSFTLSYNYNLILNDISLIIFAIKIEIPEIFGWIYFSFFAFSWKKETSLQTFLYIFTEN